MNAAGRVGRNIGRLRRVADLSQEALAFRAEIHRTQISLYETGERMPSVESLVRLAGALGVTPNDLLTGLSWEPVPFLRGTFVVTEDA